MFVNLAKSFIEIILTGLYTGLQNGNFSGIIRERFWIREFGGEKPLVKGIENAPLYHMQIR